MASLKEIGIFLECTDLAPETTGARMYYHHKGRSKCEPD